MASVPIEEFGDFHCWLFDNRWFKYDQTKKVWHYTFEWGTSISGAEYKKHYTKTTKQLYEIYKKEKAEAVQNSN